MSEYVNKDAELCEYLERVHSTNHFHFEYERGVWSIIYGPNPIEGFVGTGISLGEALQALINRLGEEDD